MKKMVPTKEANKMDIRTILQFRSALDQVNENHPKLLPFFKAVEADGIVPGMVVELTVRSPEGKERTANIKVQQSDVELWNVLRNMT